MAKSVELNSNEKVELLKAYEEAQIHVHGGAANFLLLDLTNLAKKNSTMQQEMVVGLNNYLIKNNIFVRNVSDYGLPCHLRVTIGSKEQNRTVFDKIREYVEQVCNTK